MKIEGNKRQVDINIAIMSGNNRSRSQKFEDVEDTVKSKLYTDEEQQHHGMNLKYNEDDMNMQPSPSKLLSSSLKRSSLSSSTSSLSQSSPNKRAKTTTEDTAVDNTGLHPPSSDEYTHTTAITKDIASTTNHENSPTVEDKNDSSPSALIEIINEYARDQFNCDNIHTNNIFGGWYDDGLHTDTKMSSDYEDVVESVQQLTAAAHDQQRHGGGGIAADYTSLSTIIEQRREIRWEKLLHILYATDYALRPTRQKKHSSIQPDYSSSISSYKKKSSPEKKIEMKQPSTTSNNDKTEERGKKGATLFHPVHAWIRCLTSPYLGLESCRPYGVYSVLRDMYERIPEEFTIKDETNDNKTVFQTLAENHVSNCKLVSREEIRDIVEFILEADYQHSCQDNVMDD